MKLKNLKSTGKQPEETEFADKIEGWTYLDLLLDETKEILAYIDVNLCYLHVNKAYADWLGLQKAGIIGKYVSEIIDDPTFKQLLPQFIKAFDGQHVYFNYLYQTHPIEIELIPNYKNHENIMGCIWLVKEADNAKEITTAAHEDLNKIENFLSLDIDLLSIADLTGNFLHVNSGWEKMLGFDNNKIAESNILDFVIEEDKEKTIEKLNELKTKRATIEFTNRLICKDGNTLWIKWHSVVNGPYIYAIGQNISEETSTFENLNATVTKLIELNSSKDKFFSIIAHDLKSPFNNILGFTDLLRSNLDAYGKDIIKQVLDQLYNSSKMAYELLENLLDWSILQTERIKFEPMQFNFNDLLGQCLPMLQLMASSKKISIEVSFPPELSVFADQNHTRTVLRNLISNAVKFSNENDIIYISAKKNDGIVQISIIDKGVGIPVKYLDKLFRIDTKHTTLGTLNERGTGLGLILCKDFVEKQGGKIWVESKEGEGSTFHFTLPC